MAKKDKYAKAPQAADDIQQRLYWVVAAMTGEVSKTEAAAKLGLSRTQFHNLLNQTAQSMVEAVTPKSAGRPARSRREKQLEEDNERLRRQNERLQQRVDTVDRLLGVASEMMRGRIVATPRGKRPQTKRAGAGTSDKEEPDEAIRLLEGALEMRRLGLRATLAAAVVGVSPQTAARWKRNRLRGIAVRSKRGGGPVPRWSAAAEQIAVELMRELRGLVGAATLAKSCGGLSRRSAARIKRETLTAMERDRKREAQHVVITTPGVVRGFDAMHLTPGFALIAADAAVPFRTAGVVTDGYDSDAVVRTLERDIAEHGAPLVYRMDRASCHRTPEVDELLRAHGILRLHGPPRHPGFYGQTERQNREHRQWLDQLDVIDQDELDRMLHALNTLWRRPTLGFQTAEEAWKMRPTIREDRSILREEVTERAGRLATELDSSSVRGSITDFAQRLAIQTALKNRGYLRCEIGGRC